MDSCINPVSDNPLIISDENNKINKSYELADDNRFYFVGFEEKGGEKYVCDEKE